MSAAFVAALRAGRLCLHPTDTVPGLTFDPSQPAGKAGLGALKQRDTDRPVLGLCADVAHAMACFAPLPGDWQRWLARLRPGPLSVVWRASPTASALLVAADGTIGLRVPELPADVAWFADVLREWPEPLPTTSVNISSQPAATDWTAAAAFVSAADDGFVPELSIVPPSRTMPSTLIRLHEDGGFDVLRQGAMPLVTILAAGSPA